MADAFELRGAHEEKFTVTGHLRSKLQSSIKNANWIQWLRLLVIIFLVCSVWYLHTRINQLSTKLRHVRKSGEVVLNNNQAIDARRRVAEVERQISKLQQSLGGVESETNIMHGSIYSLSTNLSGTLDKLNNVRGKSEETAEALKKSNAVQVALNDSISALNSQLKNDLNTIQQTLNQNKDQFSAQISRAMNNIQAVTQQSSILSSRISRQIDDYTNHKRTSSQQLRSISTLTANFDKLQQLVSGVKIQVQNLSKNLKDEIDGVEKGRKNDLTVLTEKGKRLEEESRSNNTKLRQSLEQLAQTLSATEKSVRSKLDQIEAVKSDLQKITTGLQRTMTGVRQTEDTMKREVELAKSLLKEEFLRNLTSHQSDTQAYVKILVNFANARTTCGGIFVALEEVQRIALQKKYTAACTYTVLALPNKRIEYVLPAYSGRFLPSFTVDDGKKYDYKGSPAQTRISRKNKLSVVFRSHWFGSSQSLVITYKAV